MPQTMRDGIRAAIEGRDLDRVPFVHYDNTAAPKWWLKARMSFIGPFRSLERTAFRLSGNGYISELPILCPSGAPETTYRHTTGMLEEAGRTGRLRMQISEDVPPGGWRKSFPQIVRAIRDFPLA